MDEQILLQLVYEAQSGDTQAMSRLIEHFQPLLRRLAKVYYLPKQDRKDILQEGRIGLWKAIQSYDQTRECTFSTFAPICIRRQIQTSVRVATRLKHQPLSKSVSMDAVIEIDTPDSQLALSALLDQKSNPLDRVVEREDVAELNDWIHNNLTLLEINVLDRHVNGESYINMATELGCGRKTIDNALQRVRRKFRNREQRVAE